MAFSHFSAPDRDEPLERDGTDVSSIDDTADQQIAPQHLADLKQRHAAALAEWFVVCDQVRQLERELADLERHITEAEQGG